MDSTSTSTFIATPEINTIFGGPGLWAQLSSSTNTISTILNSGDPLTTITESPPLESSEGKPKFFLSEEIKVWLKHAGKFKIKSCGNSITEISLVIENEEVIVGTVGITTQNELREIKGIVNSMLERVYKLEREVAQLRLELTKHNINSNKAVTNLSNKLTDLNSKYGGKRKR